MLKSFRFAPVLIIVCASLVLGQTRELPQRKQLDETRDLRLPNRKSLFDTDRTDLLKQREQLTLDLQGQALEAAVDPETYIVGPGDQFLITIWATLENSIPAPVTPEGKLLIPTVGSIDITGMTLAEVQTAVEKEARTKYLNSTISVSLARVRQVRVHVTGQVLNPGPYDALAVHRVSDVIAAAGGLTSWAYEGGIEVRHPNGTTDVIDLHRYKKYGDLEANIFVTGGDVIQVPSIDLSKPTVQVEGLVNDPGIYQLVENETVTDFLLRVDALTRRADLDRVHVERKSGNDNKKEVLAVFPYLSGTGNGHANLVLQDGDIIKVPQRQEDVYVIGSVQQPGTYPYIPGLKAQDYVGFAGGMAQASNPKNARVIRHDSKEQEKGKDTPVGPGDTVFLPRAKEFGIREVALIFGQVSSVIIALSAIGVINAN